MKTSFVFNNKTYPVSFFSDDTIETVQKQISRSIDIHPDRLFILVGVHLKKTYYKQDLRNWEKLFNRLSLDGTLIKEEPFKTYCNDLRVPPLKLDFKPYDKEEWMQSSMKDFKEDFVEYRILGVEPLFSYCLPLSLSSIALKIPAAQYPIPETQKLFLTFYGDLEIKGFLVFEGTSPAPYFPLYTAETPKYLPQNDIQILEENYQHLKDILSLKPPEPINTIILKVNWKIDLVDTEFGDAVRTRFEQMFYGLTVSKEIPSITFWTSSTDVSRHKFYRNSGENEPFLDVSIWKRWFTASKPARDKVPILILYRGESREHFDRVTISPYDIIFACYRTNKNKDDIPTLQKSILNWFETFDSIIPYVKESDYAKCRLEIQEIRIEAEYADSILEFDTSRMNCLSGIFSESSKSKTLFRFLRSDHTNDDVNPRDLKVIQLLKENRNITPLEVEKELKVSHYESVKILNSLNQKLEEDPELLNREFSKFPRLQLKDKSVLIEYVNSIDRFLTYTNILRYTLSNPESKELDRVCPKRMEVSEPIHAQKQDIEFTDLFDYLETDVKTKVPEKEIRTKSGYNYFNERVKEFDPETFHPSANYPKKCDQKYQVVILSDKELSEIAGTPYDPRKYPEQEKIEVEDPGGLIVCPEYWCMTDEIPLKESQLVEIKGELTCPICGGKTRDINDKLDVVEYSVIRRDPKFKFPKYKKDVSPINQKNLPCCYRTPATKKLETEYENKFFIMNEDKVNIPSFRLAYIPLSILRSLHIKETYTLFKSGLNRIQSGMSGYFRIGIQHPSKDLPEILGTKAIESPRFKVRYLLKCAFISLWTDMSDTYAAEIEQELTMKPFSKNPESRKKMAKIISSISEHFEQGILKQVYELEYTSILLKLDLYKINIETESLTCSFYTSQTKLKHFGIIVLQLGNQLDIVAHVARQVKKFTYTLNIFDSPFTEKTADELIKLRVSACSISNPSFETALLIFKRKQITDFSIVLDPFGRAQALYVPGKVILPFENIAIPTVKQELIAGYNDVHDLPEYQEMRDFVQNLPKYEWSEDIFNRDGYVTEFLTKSGLRIPVKPFKKEGKNTEVFDTIIRNNESELTFGEPSKQDSELYKQISYNSEIHEFLLFQLSKDLPDYPELRNALLDNKSKPLEHLLHSWFDETTHFITPHKPIEFLSKIRKPCGQFKNEKTCNSGHMCAWTNDTCKIEIRDTFSSKQVFQKLLRTLSDNSKIRSLVLDGRSTPFFSTILYLELPNELIVTDREIKQFTQTEP